MVTRLGSLIMTKLIYTQKFHVSTTNTFTQDLSPAPRVCNPSANCGVAQITRNIAVQNSHAKLGLPLLIFRKQFMRFQAFAVVIVTCVVGIITWVFTPPALALTQIKLSDLSYHECPPALAKGAVTSGGTTMSANCFIVTGKAENKSGKSVYDADIFGRIYDANNDSVMQNRTRLGSIDEVPPGVSDFELRISVSANQPTPLKLKQFKAAGFSAQVRR